MLSVHSCKTVKLFDSLKMNDVLLVVKMMMKMVQFLYNARSQLILERISVIFFTFPFKY